MSKRELGEKMAAQQLGNILHTFLSCDVCKGTLREPVSLGCNHSFCQTCLSEFCKKQADKCCPLCRRRFSRNYPINFSLKELADCFALQLQDEKTDSINQPGHLQSQMLTKRSTQDESTRPGAIDLEKDLVNWNEPLLSQVGQLGEKYKEWVHKPVDRPIRLFESDFLEGATKASWNVLPFWFVVVITLFTYNCWTVLSKESDSSVHLKSALVGLLLWIILIQFVHQLSHLHTPTQSYYWIIIHFVLHGQHHKNPKDDSRQIFPLVLAAPMIVIFFLVLRLLYPSVDLPLLLGIICGYVISDMVHYLLHHGSPSEGSWFYSIQKYHLKHHNEHPD